MFSLLMASDALIAEILGMKEIIASLSPSTTGRNLTKERSGFDCQTEDFNYTFMFLSAILRFLK